VAYSSVTSVKPYKVRAFQPTGFLNQPPMALQAAMNGLKAQKSIGLKKPSTAFLKRSQEDGRSTSDLT
jgi:hypothetical protein